MQHLQMDISCFGGAILSGTFFKFSLFNCYNSIQKYNGLYNALVIHLGLAKHISSSDFLQILQDFLCNYII